jgi:uncharacterized membrane protein (DUF106 family)
MLELAVEVLDPDVSRFQLYLAVFIALVAIFTTVLKTLLAERQAEKRKKILAEMREYKETVRKEEVRRHEKDRKKWEEGEDWPVRGDAEEEKPSDEKTENDGGGKGDGEG